MQGGGGQSIVHTQCLPPNFIVWSNLHGNEIRIMLKQLYFCFIFWKKVWLITLRCSHFFGGEPLSISKIFDYFPYVVKQASVGVCYDLSSFGCQVTDQSPVSFNLPFTHHILLRSLYEELNSKKTLNPLSWLRRKRVSLCEFVHASMETQYLIYNIFFLLAIFGSEMCFKCKRSAA